ncbi:hypothetical protein ACQKNX_22890 [Lysinibacillus sp. NPDC093712]|uniref:hypothetical protein n=1 Tax=Lysinibacillus sp. NPDC093712 TaxID=3390579 RepID=UPI003D029364
MILQKLSKAFKKNPEVQPSFTCENLTTEDIADLRNIDFNTYSLFENQPIEPTEETKEAFARYFPGIYTVIKLKNGGNFILVEQKELSQENKFYINTFLHLESVTKNQWNLIIDNELHVQ